jgi:hypothetical protein
MGLELCELVSLKKRTHVIPWNKVLENLIVLSASEEAIRLLWNSNIRYCLHEFAAVAVLSQINRFRFHKVHFNIILRISLSLMPATCLTHHSHLAISRFVYTVLH